MDLSRYLKIGLRWWWLILLSVLLSATASYFYSQRQPRIYAAKTTLMVGTNVMQTLNPDEKMLGLSLTLAEVYSELARRRHITQAVIDRLGIDISPDQLSAMIRTSIIPAAQLLEVSVLDVHPRRAQVLADAISEELIRQSPTGSRAQQDREEFIQSQLEELQTKIQENNERIEQLKDSMGNLTSAVEIAEAQSNLAELENLKSSYQNNYNQFLSNLSETSPNRLTIFEPATEPTVPISPNVKMNVAIAAAAGLVLALTAIVLLEFLNDTLVWDRGQSKITSGVPVLGAVGKASTGTNPLVSQGEVWSLEADALRNLRSSIFLTAADQTLSKLLITSPSPSEGKSYISANLAATIASPGSSVANIVASVGTRVILVDADLRKPTLHEIFDIPNLVGLADVLSMPENAFEAVLKKTLRPTDIDNLLLLPAGRTPLDPGSLLSSSRFSKVLDLLKGQADLIIIDSAPILETVETKAIANVVDAAVLVVSSGQTSKKMARKAIEYFQTRPNNILLGVAFNRVALSPSYSYYSAYSHKAPFQDRERSTKRSAVPWPFAQSQQAEMMTLTLDEVAEQLGVSENTVQRWCEQGRIPAVKKGRRWSVSLDDLNEFVAIYQAGGSNGKGNLRES